MNKSLNMDDYKLASIEDLLECEAKIGHQFPNLYRAYLLGTRCYGMEFEGVDIFSNIPEKGLDYITSQIMGGNLYEVLSEKNYIPIGKIGGGNFDLICLNFNKRTKNGDCEITTCFHEDILINYEIKEMKKVADSFEDLINMIILECETGVQHIYL